LSGTLGVPTTSDGFRHDRGCRFRVCCSGGVPKQIVVGSSGFFLDVPTTSNGFRREHGRQVRLKGDGTVPGETSGSVGMLIVVPTTPTPRRRGGGSGGGLSLAQEVPLLDLVLESGMRHAVEAAGAVNAHVALLDRSHGVEQQLAVVLAVVAALRPSLAAARRYPAWNVTLGA